ncbi:type II glyceraldehyde-3-phosphate dehydrogenase [Nesterenkonia alkaliphila]|uniref:Type II glyceraldehyde-3-phosphate dehydrogenase n=1 Tax=Nesterenkonia alkaliphila TaxID=1463631 RepID=A0A7K1ULX6_9MICC|nr:type II glyceraldehyde-3-phosphate dehydrogenase [Nesterenkonia alkaliphila]MVT27051.1 type II glyceraldehyde-3-phosphate dehydrogenase [Nesterenkonia alkaliphila]GFZ93869.1 glyceraldehyde-3-phosphate dehydrogenase [Nesterenkonia alkaliphila]
MSRIRVAVNGYGVIGKRVADAVLLQPDMELAGTADITSDWRIAPAACRIPIYAATDEAQHTMLASGIPVQGSLDELLDSSDIVVDSTPKHVAAKNIERYRSAGLKFVLQGGESHQTTGHSFVAEANYQSALGRESTRVVSCNTTSIVRVLGALDNANLLQKARGVLFRRATDPWESHLGGIMNTVVPEDKIPSHQGPDAQTVMPDLDIITIAAKSSHTQTHNHYWTLHLTREASTTEVLQALQKDSRIAFIRMSDGLSALNSTVELMRDIGRPRGDMWEVAIWEDLVTVNGNEAYLTYQVCNEAIVVPDTIDAIRALDGRVEDAESSIRITDQSLGMRQDFLRNRDAAL